ncbi:MAG: hypothetical protein CL910_00090 [Deltaproteobacteria bacterium]|nr:hypothetical protein [Deltaproteobacteria bacterium]
MGGVIRGTGTLNVANITFTNNGTISPGSSPGDLTVLGNLLQGASGILEFEIGGTTTGSFDRLIMSSGTATLGGTLVLAFVGGFAPGLGDTFDLIVGNASGGFGDVQITGLAPGFLYDLAVGPGGLTLTANSDGSFVPEPATALLLGFGILGLIAAGWRSRSFRSVGGEAPAVLEAEAG